MFPLRDDKGNVVGFSGRAISKEDAAQAKYMNSSESVVFTKGNILYGLHLAKKEIKGRGEAVLVEGNWDVLRLVERGGLNTVAPCGTALTVSQLVVLRKYCSRLIIIGDGDKAGKAAMYKNAMLGLENGFVVDVVELPDGEDPDSYFKEFAFEGSDTFYDWLNAHRKDWFKLAAEQIAVMKNQHEKNVEYRVVCKLIAGLEDTFYREQVIDLLCSVTGDKKTGFNKLVKEFVLELSKAVPEHDERGIGMYDNYKLPNEIKWIEVKDDVLKYAYFSHKNQVYMRRGDDPYTFSSVSNFNIKIIQHMEDEKRPMRLVQIVNVHGRKRTFDTSTDDFVTEISFRKMIEGKGNYDWKGMAVDFGRLVTKLKDDMGDGRMITVLGWQPEQFWVFNNAVILKDGRVVYLDEHGCFDYNDESYYVPSGNKIYERNESKYFPQKRAIFVKSGFTFEQVTGQIMKVHRLHCINTILFTVASVFRDIIHSKISFFPICFLYGEAGSGKDNLIEAMQSFFGKPQTPITITGKANTDKAKVRKFAQFENMVGHMTEYANGNDDTDQMMKSFWDGVGYERGTIDSSVGTESVQIKMSVVFTGNDYPTNDALITRIVAEEMNKSEFTDDDKREYEVLKDMTQSGYSYLMGDILLHRDEMEGDFRNVFKEVGPELSSFLKPLGLVDRMIQNAAVLGAVYKITCKRLAYPFSWDEFKANLMDGMRKQNNKRSTGSTVAHWWEIFLECIKDVREPILLGREYSVAGDVLNIQFTQVYAKYLRKHWELYRTSGTSKSVLLDKLKKSAEYMGEKGSVRFGADSRSSAVVFSIGKIGFLSDLIHAQDVAEMASRRHGGQQSIKDAIAKEEGVSEPF